MNSSLLIDGVAETTSERDRDALDQSIARLLLSYFDAHFVSIYRVIEDGPVRRLAQRVCLSNFSAVSFAPPPARLEDLPVLSDRPAWSECAARRAVVQFRNQDSSTLNVFPIESDQGVSGFLELTLMGAIPARDCALVKGILRILRNQLALLDYGESDTLTALLNRKTFETRFDKLRQRLKSLPGMPQAEAVSWLGLLDIDHFKAINDRHGHLFGDEVLLLVSRIMKSTLRGSDQLFRFGGEEFVIVLEEVGPEGAAIAFERVRAAIESHLMPQVGKVTASFGYTKIALTDVPATCIERADAALYFAKRNGRNNVQSYEKLVESGQLAGKDGAGVQGAGAVELF